MYIIEKKKKSKRSKKDEDELVGAGEETEARSRRRGIWVLWKSTKVSFASIMQI